MLRIASMTALISIVLLLPSGCERKSPTNETKDATAQAVAAAEHDPHDGHDHADHEQGNGHGHSGQRHELGSREIPGCTVVVVQLGAATDNRADLVFEIDVQGAPAPTAIRLLVRAADGAESLKVKANKVGDHEYDAHVGELPDRLGEGSVLVIEVETPSGTEELMFPLKT